LCIHESYFFYCREQSKYQKENVRFTALSGRRSVLERPLSGENGRPFLVITPEIIGY
jgi:hypothetical protein